MLFLSYSLKFFLNQYRHTGILEGAELIDHAIDRWTTYAHLCDRGIASLRDTMVDSYVKEAIETKSRQNPIRHESADSVSKSLAPSSDLCSLSKSTHRSMLSILFNPDPFLNGIN